MELTTTEWTNLRGHLELIIEEAKEMPQVGGNEATIIEQADAAIEILDRLDSQQMTVTREELDAFDDSTFKVIDLEKKTPQN